MNHEMQGEVTVVVPSYNRAYILERTIPSYLQPEVKELILVDDASTDNTAQVVEHLQKQYPQIHYIRQEYNMKQPEAKNKGISLASAEYIYFGDDDSYILPGTIGFLLETMKEKKADIVGALPLYAETGEDMEESDAVLHRMAPMHDEEYAMVDVARLEKINFQARFHSPVQVPFCHACALVKSTLAKEIRFDPSYRGNAYREETDFFLRCAEHGAVIWFDSRAVQINYPFSMINRVRTLKSMWRHGYYDIVNTMKLIHRHHWWFREKYHYSHSRIWMQMMYLFHAGVMYFGILPGRLIGIVKRRFLHR